MSDFAHLRLNMVDNQVRPSDVTDHALITAMLDIPRERFVPSLERPLAYADRDIRIGGGEQGDRHLIAPGGLARLIQALELSHDDVVLDLGCGSGYSSAILSRLAGSVVAVDSDTELVRLAETNLSELEIDNVAVVEADLSGGYPAEGPYDGILVAAGAEVVPDALTEQLSDKGRLIIVEYDGGPGRAMLYERSGAIVAKRPLFNQDAPILPDFMRKPEFVF
jgi:protein-L-isoaspartate(D-aspartate) O-methyltransferase